MPELFLGLMSGTSVDGIDAALVDLGAAQPRLVGAHEHAWPESLRQRILATRALPDDRLDRLDTLDEAIAGVFAEAVQCLLQQAQVAATDVRAIGSHGQTIRHRPEATPPFSLQLGAPARLAALTGIPVVADLRRADIEAGGQGAPLAPAFHQHVFRQRGRCRIVANIGGIANITVLPGDPDGVVTGFDTGPGNTLMDAWCRQQWGQAYDCDGQYASQGRLDAPLLARLRNDAYFALPPPKSTGFERFNLAWLEARLEASPQPCDVLRTLCELTASTLVDAANRAAPQWEEMFVCGGGVHHPLLMQRLRALSGKPVASTAALGIDPDQVEAMTFAWLAQQHLEGRPANLPSVTGARHKVVLGRRFDP